MRIGLWNPRLLGLVLLLSMTGCKDEGFRERYEAERARYWAEREEIRFSLQSNPSLRATHHATALSYLRMAQIADPERLSGGVDGTVLEDLSRLHGYARVRAGGD